MYRDEPVDELVESLRRPFFNYNMAMHRKGEPNVRLDKARKEINDIVKNYVRKHGLLTTAERDFAGFLGTANEG
jgi:hypothetical protein